MRAIRAWLSRSRGGNYGALLLLLVLIGGWLVVDFWREGERIVDERSRLAIHKSQLINRAFSDTFLAADYVLRDVIGRVSMPGDLAYPQPVRAISGRLDALLREKVATVGGLTDLVLFNGDCIFVATANFPARGTRSRQRFCAAASVDPGQSLHIQYMPPDRSASGRPVVLMSRTVGSPEGVLLAGAMAVIDLEYAQQWIAAFEIDAGDVLLIADADGTLLARNPAQAEAVGQRVVPPPNQPGFAEFGSSATFTAHSPIDGRERIYGISKLERFPFVVIVGFDRARVLAGWQHRAWQFAAGYLLLALLALLALRVQLATERQREEMRKLANTDALTGIANRRHLMQLGQRECSRARRYGSPLSVLMLDIDRFKSVNDRWGHQTGDRVIQELARLMLLFVREQDSCGRLGGEEFALLLPETDAAGVERIAGRLRSKVEDSATVHADDGSAVRFTVSIGVASLSSEDASFDAVLQRADRALYQAKEDGRNRLVVAACPAASQSAPA